MTGYQATRDWILRAACRGLDPDLFYPEVGEVAPAAKAVCQECPVRLQCLDHALVTREKRGIWGGLSERERRKVSRRRVMEQVAQQESQTG